MLLRGVPYAVCAVVFASNANFYYGNVYLFFEEDIERHHRQELEICWHVCVIFLERRKEYKYLDFALTLRQQGNKNM